MADPFPDRLRLPLAFEASRMQADLSRFAAADWTAHYVRANYEGEWSVIPLRAARGATHPLRMDRYAYSVRLGTRPDAPGAEQGVSSPPTNPARSPKAARIRYESVDIHRAWL